MTSPSLVGVDITPSYAYKIVSVGGKDSILKITVPSGHVGFLRELAFNNPSDSDATYIEWFRDNSMLKREFQAFGRNLTAVPPGSLPEPRRFEPPIVFKYSMEWIGANNSVGRQVFEVSLDGTYYEKPV